jgi:hypothetical protein
MATKNATFASVGPFPYDDTAFYAVNTDGQLFVGTAPTVAENVIRKGDVSTLVLGGSAPLSVATAAVVGTALVASREDHVHPGVDLGTAQTITGRKTHQTDLVSALIIGGIAAASILVLKSTEGVGTTDFIQFLVGNNGATEAMRIIDSGFIGIGITVPLQRLHVNGAIRVVDSASIWDLTPINTTNHPFILIDRVSVVRRAVFLDTGDISLGGGISNDAGAGASLFISTAGGIGVGTVTDPGVGMIYTNSATFMIRTKTSYANGAGVGAGTLTNAPAAGNPTKWISIDDNGTTRRLPAW